MSKTLYFITSNKHKKEEAEYIFTPSGIQLQTVNIRISEIMHLELEEIVEDKLLKAYQQFGLPCAVEHGALHIDFLDALPGGLSKVVWDTIKGKLCDLVLPGKDRAATAKSVVGYCDGRKLHFFTGETRGEIADAPKGGRDFQWDPIFIPDGGKQTFSELGFPDKLPFSQATKAWEQLIAFLKSQNP